MIIYVPYPDLEECVKVFSEEILRYQIKTIRDTLTILKDKSNPFYPEPGYLMWANYRVKLKEYHNLIIDEFWEREIEHKYKELEITTHKVKTPWYFGVKEFHDSHKAALIRVMVDHLEKAIINKQLNYMDISNRYFASYKFLHEHCKWPDIKPTMPYYWPTKIR